MALYGPVPGDMGYPSGGTDFNDCASMFARTVVEGLFGYRPDYPNGVVTIAPQFPAEWDQATIKTPDAGITFIAHPGVAKFAIDLTRSAAMDAQLPMRADTVTRV